MDPSGGPQSCGQQQHGRVAWSGVDALYMRYQNPVLCCASAVTSTMLERVDPGDIATKQRAEIGLFDAAQLRCVFKNVHKECSCLERSVFRQALSDVALLT